MRTLFAIALLAAAVAVACDSEQAAGFDPGSEPADAAASDPADAAEPSDAGTGLDANDPSPDVGQPGADASQAGGDASQPGADAGAKADAGSPLSGRKYKFKVPSKYDKNTATPLVVLLHGYSATSTTQDVYFGLSTLADQKTFVLALPEGNVDSKFEQYWNATDACCDLDGNKPDDVAFLKALVGEAKRLYNIDAKRVFFVGHSNGAFMSHRMACEDAAEIAAIVALAGDNWKDGSKCQPSEGVAVLQVHGDMDAVISYNGGTAYPGMGPYPSAKDSVATWAARNGCPTALTATNTRYDLVTLLVGNETRVDAYPGCARGAVELWTIEGGSHIPGFNSSWAGQIWDFMSSHPKP